MKLASLVEYLDGYLRITGHPDYPTALNGLQVEGRPDVERVCGAVDASEAAIDAARAAGADLLIVHHGLFWDGLRPVTGRRRRKLAKILQAELSVVSVHLPLDAHVEIGNCILLARALGVAPAGRFGAYQGTDIGWWGGLEIPRAELARRAETVLDGHVRVLEGGPARVQKVGVLTGSGAFVEAAARLGVDTVVTGEGPHHIAIDAAELGVNVLYGGHYATETFGVRALGDWLAGRFGLEHVFVDIPNPV